MVQEHGQELGQAEPRCTRQLLNNMAKITNCFGADILQNHQGVFDSNFSYHQQIQVTKIKRKETNKYAGNLSANNEISLQTITNENCPIVVGKLVSVF